MKIAVQGTRNFNDYVIFLRAMRTALSTMDDNDKVIELYPVGRIVGNFAQEFSNISENSLRGRGIKISCHKRPYGWLEDNMHEIDYFAFFKVPGERTAPTVDLADSFGVEAQIYEYK